MPAYAPPPADQGEDLYNDGPPPRPEDQGADEREENRDNNQTAVIPKSFFGSKELKPGNRCEIELDRILDDSVQVHYVAHGDDESAEGEEPMPMEESPEPSAEPGLYD